MVDSPAVIVDHEAATYRRMMKYIDPSRSPTLPKQQLEINPSHPIIKKLNDIYLINASLAQLVAEQVYHSIHNQSMYEYLFFFIYLS